MKLEPNEIWSEYQKGVTYLQKLNAYEDVKTNENFYIGKHWEGLKVRLCQELHYLYYKEQLSI